MEVGALVEERAHSFFGMGDLVRQAYRDPRRLFNARLTCADVAARDYP